MYIEIEIKNTSTFSVVVITFPSGSQTYVVLPAQMPKVNVTTGCMHPIDDINRMRILHALFQAVRLIRVVYLICSVMGGGGMVGYGIQSRPKI